MRRKPCRAYTPPPPTPTIVADKNSTTKESTILISRPKVAVEILEAQRAFLPQHQQPPAQRVQGRPPLCFPPIQYISPGSPLPQRGPPKLPPTWGGEKSSIWYHGHSCGGMRFWFFLDRYKVSIMLSRSKLSIL